MVKEKIKMSYLKKVWLWVDDMGPWLIMCLGALLLGIAIAVFSPKP